MEKQVAKLLQKQCYDKKFKIAKDDRHWIIDNVEKIQDLPLEWLYFVEIESELISPWLSSFPNLKKLTVIRSEISPEVTNAIINLIPNLISLDFHCCPIQSCELIAIMGAIEQSHLQVLDMTGHTFKETEIIALTNCIANSRLIKLCTYECIFKHDQSTQNVDGLVSIMNSVAHSSLQTLRVSECIFDNAAIVAIINCIENSSIHKLILFDCTFSNNKIITIMQAIQKSTVQILDLCHSFFDDNIGDIMKCIENSSVTKFEFGHKNRQYNCKEMSIILNSIKGNNLLHKVGFAYINIGDEVLPMICDMIENSTIVDITLWECGLQDTQMIKICNSIAKSSITSINLSANPFGVDRDCVVAICNLLECHNLRALKMMFGKLTDCFIESILPSIERSELIKFNVSHCYKLSEPIKQNLKKIMCAQKCKAATFRKMKSANNI